MHQFISETAKWGDLKSGPRVIDQHVRDRMQEILRKSRTAVLPRSGFKRTGRAVTSINECSMPIWPIR